MELTIDRAETRPENAPLQRILMVDDDPGIRDVVCDFLSRHGYEVDAAANAIEMQARLNRGPVDLVVLDIMLPGEDGLAICRRLAGADGPAIIMLSAMGEETDRIVGLEIGADDYLPKPCNPRELLARVRAVLRRREGPAAERAGGAYEFAGYRLDVLRRQGEMPQRALTWHTMIDPAAISRILHTFEDTGDVTRQTDPTDQRQSLVALTAQGLEKARQISDIREQFLADAQAGITAADISRLEATLGVLRANLERMRVDKA